MGMKVKKGDTVLVIAGKDKGAKGKVIQAYPETDRVLVEGVNRIKKHTKVSTTQRGRQVRRHRHPGGGDPRVERAGRGRRRQADQGRQAHRFEKGDRRFGSPAAPVRTSEHDHH